MADTKRLGPYFDRQGNPITVEEWARLRQRYDERLVGRTTVGEYSVTTVWLGYDQTCGQSEQPRYFGTLVGRVGDMMDASREWVWADAAEAEAGHWTLVEQLKAGRALPDLVVPGEYTT